MDILSEIVAYKRKEVDNRRNLRTIEQLKKSDFYERNTLSLSNYLLDKKGFAVISEFKRKSPSKGIINDKARVEDVVTSYFESGAAALSILTDYNYFGGSEEDILKVRNNVLLPILRKDFIIDEYQVYEAKSIGADAILLIAACLNREELNHLFKVAISLNLEVLFEIHEEKELDKIPSEARIIGINNRNLKTFEVDIYQSIKLANKIPSNVIKVAESGIKSANDAFRLSNNGFDAFLIGEQFMKHSNPGNELCNFLNMLKELKK